MTVFRSFSRRAHGFRIVATAAALAVVATAIPAVAEPAFAASCTIVGTQLDDILQGTEGDDVICGGGGNDTIFGLGGNDRLLGGAGDDLLSGGDGDDVLLGEQGDDKLNGDAGDDVLSGSSGSDRLDGGEGNDTLDGGNDRDVLLGGAGNDSINGSQGNDVLDGGPGDDGLDGGNGDDLMFGGFGSDSLNGGLGDDTLFGGPGQDELDGGKGEDSCDGDTGSNTFAFCSTVVDPGGLDPEGEWTDTDGDAMPDAVELRAGTDPLKADTDGDGISDADELRYGGDPLTIDTDGNGIPDGDDDPDADGVTTWAEVELGTSPGNPDSDGDGLTDGEERELGSDPPNEDSDGDGLTDAEEQELGSDLLSGDGDGDGVADGDELFSKDFSLDSPSATFHAVGTAKAVLAVELYAPEDGRLVAVPGQRGPPVGVDAPLPLESGTLTFPFEPVEGDNDLIVLHFDEESGTFDQPADQSIDYGTSTATVTTSDFSPFIVASSAGYSAGWSNPIAIPRDPVLGSVGYDIVLAISEGYWDERQVDSYWRHIGPLVDFAESRIQAGDRVGIVDSDWLGHRLQGLTSDFSEVEAVLHSRTYESHGSTHWNRGLETALDLLDEMGDPQRERVIVFVDGATGAWTQSYDYTSRAVESSTTIYAVNFFPFWEPVLLPIITQPTGGEYWWSNDVAGVAGGLIALSIKLGGVDDGEGGGDPVVVEPGVPDTDGDGIADEAELAGWRDGSGRFYHTDPLKADTDGDGLSDGEEANSLMSGGAFGTGTYYNAVSNPLKADSDRDGLGDLYEVANILMPWVADYDRDKLNDYFETQLYNTEPWADDTDVDGHPDQWEIAHEYEGYDPLFYDKTVTFLDYVGDFTRGALCGDIEDNFFCKPGDNLAYLGGNTAAGFIVVGDIRDLIANVFKGDVVAAGFSIFAVVPFIGDAASWFKKTEKFIRVADEVPSGAALRAAMKDGMAWDFFTSENGTIGPDVELLQLLAERNLAFTLWIA